jgi:hypothetical protein
MSSTAEMNWTPTKQAILGSNADLALYGEVSVWFHKLDLFRKDENLRMFLQEPAAEDLHIHKRLILRLIADGEHLLSLIRQADGLPDNREKIKETDLAAAVEDLRDTYRGWHEPISPERRKEILTAVFGNVA